MWESIKFCHMAHSMKKIEFSQTTLKIKTNLKIEIFYFLWFNVSK